MSVSVVTFSCASCVSCHVQLCQSSCSVVPVVAVVTFSCASCHGTIVSKFRCMSLGHNVPSLVSGHADNGDTK